MGQDLGRLYFDLLGRQGHGNHLQPNSYLADV